MSIKPVVFYADDDSDDILLLQTAFQNYSKGVQLITAGDGKEALDVLQHLPANQNPCLIILDINMPKVNGKEVLKKLRTIPRFENSPVILFTTSSQTVDKEFAKKYNAGFITKPIEIKQLEKITETFIQHCSDEIHKHDGKDS